MRRTAGELLCHNIDLFLSQENLEHSGSKSQIFIPTDENINKEGKTWISCFGKLSFLCGNLGECQALVSKIRNVDVLQPENLLSKLVDVVERVNQVSSSLLSNTEEVLAQIRAQENVIEKVSKFVPIDRYPGCRRPILTDKDKVYLIQQSLFLPALGRHPRNPDILPSKQCHFFIYVVQKLSTCRIFGEKRCCVLFCLPAVSIWYWYKT